MNVTQDEEDTPQKEGNIEEIEEEGSLSQTAIQSSPGAEEVGPLEFDNANDPQNVVGNQNAERG